MPDSGRLRFESLRVPYRPSGHVGRYSRRYYCGLQIARSPRRLCQKAIESACFTFLSSLTKPHHSTFCNNVVKR